MAIQTPRTLSEIVQEEQLKRTAEAAARASDYPYHIAMVVDGVVQQVFHVDEKLAAVLLGSPTIVQCESPLDNGPDNGWKYNAETGTFSE